MMNRAQDRIQVKRNRLTVYEMTLTGLMAAVLCVLGPVSLVIGVSPVPISLGTLAVCLAAAFYEALWAGVIPFIPGDLVKMAAAALLGTTLRARLIRAGLLDGTH